MRVTLTVCVVLLCVPLFGSDLTIDLATEKTAVEPIEARLYTSITITNAIPGKNYSPTIELKQHDRPAIDFKKSITEMQADDSGGGVAAVVPRCTYPTVNAALAALRGATSETDVPGLVQDLNDAVLTDQCQNDPVIPGLVTSMIERTTRTVSAHLPLQVGDIVTVKVQRVDDDTLQWTKSFDTGERGRFLTHVGMSFLPDRDDQYFTKQTAEEEFTITKKKDRRTARYAPTVFFTWSPQALRSRNLISGPTVGLGFDLEHPTAMLGWSLTYNQTWGVAIGAAAQPQKRLVGQYSEGDKLKEQLAEDLLTEDTFRPNFFVSILWRRGN